MLVDTFPPLASPVGYGPPLASPVRYGPTHEQGCQERQLLPSETLKGELWAINPLVPKFLPPPLQHLTTRSEISGMSGVLASPFRKADEANSCSERLTRRTLELQFMCWLIPSPPLHLLGGTQPIYVCQPAGDQCSSRVGFGDVIPEVPGVHSRDDHQSRVHPVPLWLLRVVSTHAVPFLMPCLDADKLFWSEARAKVHSKPLH